MNTMALIDAINQKDLSVGIIGLGYVGLPLALNFAQSGFSVLGFDVDEDKIEKLLRKIQQWPGVRRTETQIILSSYK